LARGRRTYGSHPAAAAALAMQDGAHAGPCGCAKEPETCRERSQKASNDKVREVVELKVCIVQLLVQVNLVQVNPSDTGYLSFKAQVARSSLNPQ